MELGSSGLLICGSVLGLDRALHFGLYEHIHLSLAVRLGGFGGGGIAIRLFP